MEDHEILVGLERGLVPHDGILWDADRVQRGPDGTQATDDHRTFHRAHDGADQGAPDQDRTDAGNAEESRSDDEAPESTPQPPGASPELHAVAGVEEAHDLLLAVITLADDGELLHVEAGLLQRPYRLFGARVLLVDRDGGFVVRHDESPVCVVMV